MEVTPRGEDLAPGDRRAAAFDWSGLTVHRVTGPGDPAFEAAYRVLWDEFGPRGEMETRRVIAARLAWDPRRPSGDHARQYEMLVVRQGDAIVAVRDHTAVVRTGGGPVVVHLSHVLIAPSHRGSGLAAWLRALPLGAARRCAAAAGRTIDAGIILVAEMEHPAPADAATMVRLRSYERAGFRKVDPAAAPYAQPDFRPPDELGDAPPAAIPLALIVRHVGLEHEIVMKAADVVAVIEAIYGLYAEHLAPPAVATVQAAARQWLAGPSHFALVPPTA